MLTKLDRTNLPMGKTEGRMDGRTSGDTQNNLHVLMDWTTPQCIRKISVRARCTKLYAPLKCIPSEVEKFSVSTKHVLIPFGKSKVLQLHIY